MWNKNRFLPSPPSHAHFIIIKATCSLYSWCLYREDLKLLQTFFSPTWLLLTFVLEYFVSIRIYRFIWSKGEWQVTAVDGSFLTSLKFHFDGIMLPQNSRQAGKVSSRKNWKNSLFSLHSWVFGDFLCKIYHFINCLSYTASIFILVVICMERYLAIQHPISSKHILTSSRLKGVILIVWLGSMIYSLPKFLYVQTITNKVDDEIGEEI